MYKALTHSEAVFNWDKSGTIMVFSKFGCSARMTIGSEWLQAFYVRFIFQLNFWKHLIDLAIIFIISTFNKEKYGKGWVLTENFHCTISACVNISSPEGRNVIKCCGTKWFYITFNNVTNFIKGTLMHIWKFCNTFVFI